MSEPTQSRAQAECGRVPRPTCISFSGGRTSGLMLWSFLRAYGGQLPDDVRVIFTNTGKERPETLDFVHECSERWSVAITWLEFRPGDEQWAEVGHNSASRAGEPFAALIGQRNALPNPVARMCTEALKVRPMVRYCRDVAGWQEWSNAVGIRADEPKRMARVRDCATKRVRERYRQHAPLGDAGVTALDVAEFWAGQPFDLGLPITLKGKTLGGNCDLCFLKSAANIAATIKADPSSADWWVEQEERQLGVVSPQARRFRVDRPTYREMRDAISAQGDLFDDLTAIECACTD